MSNVNTIIILGVSHTLSDHAHMSVASMATTSGRTEEEIRSSVGAAMGCEDPRSEAFLRGDSVPMTVTEARDMRLIAAEEVHRKLTIIEANIANSVISEEALLQREMNNRFEDPDGCRDWAARPATMEELAAREQRRRQ